MKAVSVSTESPHTLWSSLVEAVRGSHQDYTKGSLNRAILLLAVPMVLEMVLESLFAVVDVFWVGRLGANAIATVGLTDDALACVLRGHGIEWWRGASGKRIRKARRLRECRQSLWD